MIPVSVASPTVLTLAVTISAANLLALLGIGVRVWIANRGLSLRGQPIQIQTPPALVQAAECRDRGLLNEADHQNIFSRMSSAEQRIASTEATIVEIKAQYVSIDTKLTSLLRLAGPEEHPPS